MKTTFLCVRALTFVAVAATLVLPNAAHAYRTWLLPSGTIFSAKQPWVTVDAAMSNDLFTYEFRSPGLEDLVVLGPDGQRVKAQNLSNGPYRSSFDVKLDKQGTYRFALVTDSIRAFYTIGNEKMRLRGTAESLAKDIPANAEDLRVSYALSRVEAFVTSGKPTTGAFKPTGLGIELVPVTHPNDLVVGETATFRFLDNGKPAVGYNASVVVAGQRYRSEQGEIRTKTDTNGEIKLKWLAAGMYFMKVTPPSASDAVGPGVGVQAAAGAAPAARPASSTGTLAEPVLRAHYSLTLEVLPN